MKRRKIKNIRYARPRDDQPGWTLSDELSSLDWEGAAAHLKSKQNPANLLRIRPNPPGGRPGKG